MFVNIYSDYKLAANSLYSLSKCPSTQNAIVITSYCGTLRGKSREVTTKRKENSKSNKMRMKIKTSETLTFKRNDRRSRVPALF